jgi:lipoprotein-releasing system permease protein
MVRIATAAVAISIAVAIITISVIFGFKEQISSLISSTVSDITISSPYAKRQPELHPITDNDKLRTLLQSVEDITHFEPYILRSGIVRGESGATGIILKGVGIEADLALISERLERGTMPQMDGNRRKEILLSKSVAEQIGATANSRIEILVLDDDTPRREVFKVCGIYRSALGETGAALALTDIRNLQKLNGWEPSQITGYACRIANSELSEECAYHINLQLLYGYDSEESVSAVSAQEEYAHIFGWLATHDINAIVILTIMLIVAIFNMVTALLILVLERTRMVGILKSLGMQNRTLRRIFTYRAVQIIAKGVVLGNAFAVAILLLQRHLHIVKLDESGYFLSEVPVAISAGWMIGLNLLFVAIIVIAMHLAASIVGRIKVAEAIKYN